MKQYVSFQRLDIICSIQCLTEFYLKRFLPDLLLIQLGGFRKGGKFSVCEYTHGIAVLHRVGKVMQNHHDRPALLRKALQKFHQLELCCHREPRVPAPPPRGTNTPPPAPKNNPF